MTQFTDTKNRTWHVDVNFATLERLRDGEMKLDFLDRKSRFDFEQLQNDDAKLVGVLFDLLSDQLADQGVTPDDFASGLGGDVLDAAYDAFVDGLINFCRNRNGQRDLLRKLKDKADEVATMEVQAGTELIDDPKVIETMKTQIQTAREKMLTDLASGKPPTNSPESSESTTSAA